MSTGENQAAVMDEIRRAFASGKSEDGEKMLNAALEAGIPWDVVTRAVAEGVARRYQDSAADQPR